MNSDCLDPAGRVGLVGAGAFGRFCLEAYRASPDLDVVAVADADSSMLDKVADGVARLETDWRVLVDAADIEVIHIVTPPDLRRPILEGAVAAGKSVFCEKPPALSLPELDQMLAAAQRHHVVFGVDYVMRHHPAYRFLIKAAKCGVFGAARTVSFVNLAQNVPPGHWFWDVERSGGIFVEHGIHFFDAYRQILGPPRSIRATLPSRRAAEAHVEYAEGALATYFHEFAYPPLVERTQSILGFDRATLTVEGWIPTRVVGSVLTDAGRLSDIASESGVAIDCGERDGTEFVLTFPDRQRLYREAIAAGMRDVLRRHRHLTRSGTPTIQEIRDSLGLALAAQRAADSGQKIVFEEGTSE